MISDGVFSLRPKVKFQVSVFLEPGIRNPGFNVSSLDYVSKSRVRMVYNSRNHNILVPGIIKTIETL
jgi:hypothetical protein